LRVLLSYNEIKGEFFDVKGNPCETTMTMIDSFLADLTKSAEQTETWQKK